MILVHYVPLYWGLEKDSPDRSLVTRATLHEVLPPYRQSDWAYRIRVSPRHWLHLGRFHYDSTLRRYGLDAEPSEIAEWRSPRVEEKDRSPGADAEPV